MNETVKRDDHHKVFCTRLVVLANLARLANKHYNEQQDAFYKEMMGRYWSMETNR